MESYLPENGKKNGIKGVRQHPRAHKATMKRLRRQRHFLTHVLKEANRNKRQRMLQFADKDQINAISEMVLNLLKKRVPINAMTYGKLKRHKKVLREVGRRKNSLKRRREHLLSQNRAGFWSGLHGCFKACCVR